MEMEMETPAACLLAAAMIYDAAFGICSGRCIRRVRECSGGVHQQKPTVSRRRSIPTVRSALRKDTDLSACKREQSEATP